MCRNWKMWIGFAAAAAVVALFAPNPVGVLPILLVAACPLMMLVMAGGMAGMARSGQARHPADNAGDENDRPWVGATHLDEQPQR